MVVIVDRRQNPHGKSIVNSQRFKEKIKDVIKESVLATAKSGKIGNLGGDSTGGGAVTISADMLREPGFHFAIGGSDPWVLPGNPYPEQEKALHYIEGDKIPKPQGGSRGPGGGPGESFDEDFIWKIPKDEFQEYLFDGLELPNLEENQVSDVESVKWTKAGYKISGSPSALSIKRTVKNSMARRFGLARPKDEDIEALEAKFLDPNLTDEENTALLEEITRLKSRMAGIPWIDNMDVRYHHYTPQPKPIYNAVMFCLMDVSGSMTEHYKDMAKRFYILMYQFLKSKYPRVEVVFIRYHSSARTCTEDQFFYDRDSGGTVISTSIEELIKNINEKFSPEIWNIYVAQTSDGDNWAQDNQTTKTLLIEKVLPVIKYFAYIQVGDDEWSWGHSDDHSIWRTYEELSNTYKKKFAPAKVKKNADIFPVFHKLFEKRQK